MGLAICLLEKLCWFVFENKCCDRSFYVRLGEKCLIKCFSGETGCNFSEEKQEEASACCLLLIGIGTAKDGEAAIH